MLSYDAALTRILSFVSDKPREEMVAIASGIDAVMPLLGRPLLHDVVSDVDLPPFANSAIDGYAIRALDTESASPDSPVLLPVTQIVAAGATGSTPIKPGEAAQIFTGAPIPPGADALVMVEDTESVNGGRDVRIFAPASSGLIRSAGSDLTRGTVAIAAGEPLTPGGLGLLASLNQTHVQLAVAPRIALLTTGDEVVPLGAAPLQPGQIRNSNGPAITAAVREAGGTLCYYEHVPDDPAQTKAALENALQARPDVILAAGGVSVGDRDFVKGAIEEVGSLDLWRVAIKPGKPLTFGHAGHALFFGLPGNPVSALVTFELFVRPVIRKMLGFRSVTRPQVSALLTQSLRHEPGRREFVRVTLTWESGTYHATPTGAQGSHRLSSLLGADALLVADEAHGDYVAGEPLPALLLR